MAEGARLESVFRGNSNEGSNPSLSARVLADVTKGDSECSLAGPWRLLLFERFARDGLPHAVPPVS